jgi:hypothetical protein
MKRKKMKRTILSLLVIGLYAGVGTSAIAQNVTVGDQPNADARTKAAPEVDSVKGKPGMHADEAAAPEVKLATDRPGMNADEPKSAKSDTAAAARWKAQYTAAPDKAQTVYKDPIKQCDTLEGAAKNSCMTNATSARAEAVAQAKTQWKGHLEMDGRPARPTKGDLDKVPSNGSRKDRRRRGELGSAPSSTIIRSNANNEDPSNAAPPVSEDRWRHPRHNPDCGCCWPRHCCDERCCAHRFEIPG